MNPPLTSLIRAVMESSDEVAILNLLRSGCDLNIRDRATDRTALYEAAAGNRLAIVKLLLKWKANVNLRCRGETALHVAARLGHKKVVQELLKSDVDLEITNNAGQTALYLAVCHGHSQIAKLLALKIGERRCCPTDLVSLAVKLTTEDVVLALLERCCNCQLDTHDKETGLLPLHLAVQRKYHSAVKMMSKKIAELVNMLSVGHLDALYLATANKDLKMVKLLVKYGAKMKLTSQGYPLHLAAAKGSHEILEYFLRGGHGHIDIHDLDGSTVLHAAVRSGSLPVVNLCLGYGADPRARSLYKKRTVLSDAVSLGHYKLVKLLLDRGCDVAEGRKKCCTLITTAIAKEHEDIVEILLERGAVLSATRHDFCDDMIDMAVRALVTVAERFGSSKPQHIIESIKAVQNFNRWRWSYSKCTAEFKNLANQVIHQDFTLRDSLVGDAKSLARLARNSNFVKGFYRFHGELDTFFPIFSKRLKHNFDKAVQRCKCMKKTDAALGQALPFLPATCRYLVMRDLDDEDLVTVSSAVFHV